MNIFNIITLFGGLALFLYGMRIMGDGLTKGSSDAFRQSLKKVTNNPVAGFLVGLLITAVIQSSTATIVITSGLVAAGLMTFKQSLGIILGANVGTTVTGQIIRLLDINASENSVLNFFKPSTLAPVAAVIGIVCIMFIKSKSSDNAGQIAMGFGILFTGLLNMTAAVSPLAQSETFRNLFLSLSDKPLLGFIAGAAAAFLIQSSSATIGILQALSTTGALSLSSIYSIIIGIYIGDCITTAIVCSVGAKADAKRTGIAHIIFNLCCVVIVAIVINVLHASGALDNIWSAPISSGGIANTHSIFKIGCAILFIPLTKLLEKGAMAIVKDDPKEHVPMQFEGVELLDTSLYRSPALAISSIRKAMVKVAQTAEDNYHKANQLIHNFDVGINNEISGSENYIDFMTDHISSYLVGLSNNVSGEALDVVNYNIKCILEYERIGDLAKNLAENAEELKRKGMKFSDVAVREMDVLHNALSEVLGYATAAYREKSPVIAKKIEPVEEVVDELVEDLRARHVQRLQSGVCNVIVGSTFLDMLVNIERISDQCANIGVYTISLFDRMVAQDPHEFLKRLHAGEFEEFNKAYDEARGRYMNMLAEAEKTEA